MRALGGNLPHQLISGRVHLIDDHSAHDILALVEELVVVNARSLAEDPLALRTQIGLHGAALDLVAQRVLPAVGFRHIVVIEGEQSRRSGMHWPPGWESPGGAG